MAVLLWVGCNDQPPLSRGRNEQWRELVIYFRSHSWEAAPTTGMWTPTQTCLSQVTPAEVYVTPKLCWHMAENYSCNYSVYYKEVIMFNKLAYFLKSWTLRFWWKEFSIEKLVFYQIFLNILHFPIPDSYHPCAAFLLVYHDLSQEPWEQARHSQPGQRSTGQLCPLGPVQAIKVRGKDIICHTAQVNQGTKVTD